MLLLAELDSMLGTAAARAREATNHYQARLNNLQPFGGEEYPPG